MYTRALAIAFTAASITTSHAASILVDDFTGNSSGVPAGWTDIGFDGSPASTVTESGSVVSIVDVRGSGGPQLIQSPTFSALDTFDLAISIASSSPFAGSEPEVTVGIGSFSNILFLQQFNTATKSFRVTLFGGASGGLALPGSLPSYAGGALDFSVIADNDSFRITSPTDAYDSGDILFSSVGDGTFTSINQLGSSLSLIIGTESAGTVPDGTPSEISYDQVNLNGTPTVPEPSHTLLLGIAALALVTRRQRRN